MQSSDSQMFPCKTFPKKGYLSPVFWEQNQLRNTLVRVIKNRAVLIRKGQQMIRNQRMTILFIEILVITKMPDSVYAYREKSVR